MTLKEFLQAIESNEKPSGLSEKLDSLWQMKRDDWEGAHNIAQEIHTDDGSRIHAYLHRVEGDLSNAGYWYRRAGDQKFKGSLYEEWEYLVKRYL